MRIQGGDEEEEENPKIKIVLGFFGKDYGGSTKQNMMFVIFEVRIERM